MDKQKEMKSLRKSFKTKIFSISIMALALTTIGQMVYASTKDPGSKEDPIVTLSYLELKIDQLKDYIDQKSFSSNNPQPTNPVANSTYEVVELKRGQRLLAGAGTEVIIRSGEATAITSSLGGLSDVTGAKDIQQDEKIPANHLLIIPRDDGRGVRALADSFLLVRGGYKIN